MYVLSTDEYVACLAAQARAVALGTKPFGNELAEFLAYDVGIGLPVAPLEIGNNALEGMLALVTIATVPHVGKPEFFATGTEQHYFAHFLRQLLAL